jgi:LL-diaminopimelate aminotransferase
MKQAKRLDLVPPYLFAGIRQKINEARARGVDVISLGIADPDQPTPDHIIDELTRAIRDENDADRHRYGGDIPVPDFAEAVASYYKKRFGVTLDPAKEVLTLIGSKEGIQHVSWAFIEPGDVALAPEPGYPVYSMGALFAGGWAHFLPLKKENHWLPDLDSIPLSVLQRAKILWLNYPNNPTAATATREFFAQAVALAHKYGFLICHDAALIDITFDGYVAPSILEVDGAKDVAMEFYSLSKPYNMTGWRIAAAVGNAQAVGAVGLVKEYTDSGVLRAIQFAGAKALTSSQDCVRRICAIYQRRRDIAYEGLRRVGIQLDKPKGSLYVWAEVPAPFKTSAEFAEALLEKAGVVVTPGRGYGEAAEGYFRLSLTYPDARMQEAMERITKALGSGF